MTTPDTDLTLRYTRPAQTWFEALPVANGRMGAMIFGGALHERLLLTESTCWAGEPSLDNVQPGAAALLPEIRAALFAEDYTAAENLCQRIAGNKLNYGTNLPLGNLTLTFDGASESADYARTLGLDTALAAVTYTVNGVTYTREVLASNPDQVIAVRIAADVPGRVTFAASLDGGENPYCVTVDASDLVLDGHAFENTHSDGQTGVVFHGRVRIIAEGGRVAADGDTLRVTGADAAVLLVALGTTFGDADPVATCRAQIEAAAAKPYPVLRADHVTDHQRLFRRVTLDLGMPSFPGTPTDARLARVKDGDIDPALTALMFQYGRYLLLGSSRAHSPLPTHLQGVWNDNVACRIGWTCDMHLDVNTQMNYWPAEVTNLSECTAPLSDWIEQTLVPSGRRTAQAAYGAEGWVAHTVSNAWGFSAPGWSTYWGLHPTGGAWIATHLWEHYRFTGDRDFLAERAYPVLKGAAEFFLSYLVHDPETDYLLSGPTSSPENAFLHEGARYTNSLGPTCDSVIVREVFSACIETSETLACDDDLRARLEEARSQLPPFQVGRWGQLQEWLYDHEEALPQHRHTSHLLSVFPFHQVNPDDTPELVDAARVSIARRTQPQATWEDTGWARSLLMLYAARLHDGEATHNHILDMQRGLTAHNLFVFHPPAAGAGRKVWELDGNTGLCACIAEMLVQSHRDEVHLLPALPVAWPDGRVTGLRARGGFEVDIAWQDGVLTQAVVRSDNGAPCRVRYGDDVRDFDTEAGGRYELTF